VDKLVAQGSRQKLGCGVALATEASLPQNNNHDVLLPRAICTTYASANHNAAQQPLQRDRQADVFRYAVCLTHNCLSRVPFHVFLRHRPRPRERLDLATRIKFDSVQSPSFWKWKVGQTWSDTTWTGRPLKPQDHEASTSLRTTCAGISQ
jgi:hypothetical protein